MSLEELCSQALTLAPRERAALVHILVNSLDSLSADDIEPVWATEADTRLEELRAGTVEEIPGPEVLRKARALIG